MKSLRCIFVVFLLVNLKIFKCQKITKQSFDATNRISRQHGNILKNLTKTQQYENNIVTSPLDASTGLRLFYRGFREVYSRYV